MAHKTIALTTELREHLKRDRVQHACKQKLCIYMARVRRPAWCAHAAAGAPTGSDARGARSGPRPLRCAWALERCRSPCSGCGGVPGTSLRRPCRWAATRGRASAGRSARKHNISGYSLRVSSPRPMAHKTIALTTELREHLLPRGQQVDMRAWLLGTLLCKTPRLGVHSV